MDEVKQLKHDLLVAIGGANSEGGYAPADIDRIHELVEALIARTPLPRPVDREDFVTSPWGTLFAQFGPKHTAGKPVSHETNFQLLTFNNLPKRPFRNLDIEQEIHHATKDYNNVHMIETIDGSFQAQLIVYGRYSIDPAAPQRYKVAFYKLKVRGPEGSTDDAVRAAFGFDADQPLEVSFKPPSLHSDVVYCDEDMRINHGSMGGLYVLNRLRHHGHSVAFA